MPILAGGLVTEAPQIPEEAFTPPTTPWREDLGSITATWIDPDGGEWQLSNDDYDVGWFTINGPAGWGAASVELIVDPLPRGGEQVRYIRSKPRRLQWPVYIGGEDYLQFSDRYRALMRAFTKTTQRGAPGWLVVARGDGRRRMIACYYEQGMEGDAGQNHLFAKPVLTLYAPDGYWSDGQPIRSYRQFTSTGTPEEGEEETPATFFSPFMTIGSSKLVDAGGDEGGGGEGGGEGTPTTIINPGDVEAWPEWTIRGPMSKITAENVTLGSRFAVTHTLLPEQTITITTNRPTVRGPGDQNLTGKVDWFNPAGTELWPLRDGANEIRFRVDGAGPGTRVDLLFTPRYESA